MGETILVRALTADMIAGGEALLRRLDQEDLPVVAAFWLYEHERCAWSLILATPRVDHGIRLLYRRVRLLLAEMGETRVNFQQVVLARPSDPEVEYYGYQVWRGRLPKNMIEHIDGGDRYLYRFLPRRLRG